MYESFFGLSREPFSVAPDPLFLYMSQRHREALMQLNRATGIDEPRLQGAARAP